MSDDNVSRVQFEERSNMYMEFFKNDKENIKELTSIAKKHEVTLGKITALEEAAKQERAQVLDKLVDNSVILGEVKAITKDHAGRIDNHAGRIRSMEDKTKKRMEEVITKIIIAIATLAVGALFSHFFW